MVAIPSRNTCTLILAPKRQSHFQLSVALEPHARHCDTCDIYSTLSRPTLVRYIHALPHAEVCQSADAPMYTHGQGQGSREQLYSIMHT